MSTLQLNLLLQSLPPAERSALESRLKPVSLPVETVLFEDGERPRYIYFITSGMASLVAAMAGGQLVEVGLTGREGLTGGLHLLGDQFGLSRCFMQLPGSGLRIDFRTFQDLFFQHPGLNRRVLQHVQYQTIMLGQLSACNRVHEVEERLARWLLMVSDRIGQAELGLTQEFLGEMLGARRSTVTVVAGTLQRSGLIEYHRGHVSIINREGLEDVACECYSLTRKLLDNLYQEPAIPAH